MRSATVIGLGKLGAPIAACLASKGLQITGADLDPAKVAAINSGGISMWEPGLEELIKAAGSRLSATTDVYAAVGASDATFIVVPTPSRADGGFSLEYVLSACEQVGSALSAMDWHLVVLTSTVLPGGTGNEVRETLERASGKSCGVGFGLCYSPEFVALGNVISNFLHPDFVLIGESDRRSGDALASLYRDICENDPPIMRTALINSEIAKLALNTFVTTKIAFANMLAEVCERVPGGDIDAVTSALGRDSRIGPGALKGALGFGGPCFPRDNAAFAMFVRSLGLDPAIPEATDEANRFHSKSVLAAIRARLSPGETVGILGLTYRPDTDVIERSPGLELATALAESGISVVAHDPAASVAPTDAVSNRISLVHSVDECVERANVIVIATPWKSFNTDLLHALKRSDGNRRVIDCWRTLDERVLEGIAVHVRLGVA